MRRLGVDFGDSKTVVAETGGLEEDRRTSILFSETNLIHLAEDGNRIMGNDVLLKGLDQLPSTARHLRHFIMSNSPVQVRCGQHTASYPELGQEYLVSLIYRAVAAGDPDVDELVFSVPSGSPPFYREWLGAVAAGAGIPKCLVTDEIFAAAAGYGIPLKKDLVLMLIDIRSENTEITVASLQPSEPSCGSHIIARTFSDISEKRIDRWIAAEVFKRCSAQPHSWDEGIPSRELLADCRKIIGDLSRGNTAEIHIADGLTGKNSILHFTRQDLGNTLQDHNACTELDRASAQALALAESRGYTNDNIQYVLMTGEGSLIPSLQATILSKFGQERVRCDLPAAAVALGTALYPVGTGETRTLECDYALRYWDAETSRHEYRYIARRGTAYPTRQETARVLISAAYDGQTHLGLAVYAFAKDAGGPGSQAVELVFDHNGRTRCIEHDGGAEIVGVTWINESAPTILVATPPGRKGDVRFELAFRIDSLGLLRLDARDVVTGKTILENHSCVALR